MESKIRIYGKSKWPFTNAAREAYAKKNVEVEYVDVQANDDDMKAMLELSDGNRRVPVIVEGEKVAIGFGGRSWRVWYTRQVAGSAMPTRINRKS